MTTPGFLVRPRGDRRHRRSTLALTLLVLAVAVPAAGREEAPADARPAFSLHSSSIATSKQRPSVNLMFRRVTSLDFRVYRVDDPIAFFSRLRDPHVLGGPDPVVPQEQTALERLAAWKSSRREAILRFFRRQFSHDYRRARAERRASRQVALRQPLEYRQFAQVPLLNTSNVVATWREMLPPVRDAEYRSIPLELPGEGVYVVEAVSAPLKAYTIVVVSDLGLVTKASPGQLLLFAANRFTGEPVTGCPAAVIARQKVLANGTLGADGTFEARVPDLKGDEVIAVARCGRQVAATDPGGWYLTGQERIPVAYVYTDKPVYRPGHAVHLKGILRWRAADRLVPIDRSEVEVSVADPNSQVVYRQTRRVDEFGAVLASFPIPPGAALGYYSVRITGGDYEAHRSFEVQEYRKPEFEVALEPVSRFVVQGGKAVATIKARYYFGQPVAGGEVKYVVHKRGYYSPLRWSEDEEADEAPVWYGGGEQESEASGRLDEQGQLRIEVPLDPADDQPADYSARIEARVTDASGREVSGSTTVHATVGRFLLVARADNYAYSPGARATLSIRAMDYLGNPQGRLPVTVALERLRYPGERWEEPEASRLGTQSVTTDEAGTAACVVPLPNEPGDYRLRAEADSGGRVVFDQAWAWVPGGTATVSQGEEQLLELVADRKSYQPGDTATFRLKGDAPVPAAVLITKEGQQVGWRQVVRPEASAPSFQVPIDDADVGDVWVNIAFLRNDRFFRAEKRVRIPAVSRQLQVSVTPERSTSRPGQPAAFVVSVSDSAGRPVRAQVSLGVIDEAVYGVQPDTTADPVRVFHRREYSSVGTQFSREYFFSGYSGTERLLLAQRRRPTSLADFKAERPGQQVRKEFPDAIFWVGDLVTAADGRATVRLTYPDSLTTWRLTARAVTPDTLVGQTITRTTTTKDLIVRVIPPRFLTEGDEVAIPTVVHNYLPGTASVTTAMRAENISTSAGQTASGSAIVIPPRGEHRQDWRFLADRVGRATFTASATAGSEGDAVELSIPVLPFGLKRQAGTSGSLAGDGEATATLQVPASANPAARTLRVSLAPSLAGPLLNALEYLVSYPYGCTEQTVSGFLPNLLVLRTLDQLKVAPTERMQRLNQLVTEGLERLYDHQHEDGGWGWWKTDRDDPFMTAYALYGLVETRKAGFKVQERRIQQATKALARMVAEYPRAVPDLKAYMAYVLTLAAAPSPSGALQTAQTSARDAVERAWEVRGRMTAHGQALLLLSLDAARDGRATQVWTTIEAAVRRKGDLAWWPVERDTLLGDYGDTSVEATAFVVKALVARDARHPLLEPAVRWLVLNRDHGTWWSSTKQTAMVLYGLLDYMRVRGEGTGTSSVEVLVNGNPAGQAAFDAASIASAEPVVFSAPANEGANTVSIRRHGGGAVYWSATAEYYDRSAPLERTGSRKLALERKYFSLSPVTKDGRVVYRETPFSGRAQPGDLLLVRLSAAGSPDWRYLMIEDPLPAGVEAIRQHRLYELERPREFWDGSRREYRDDRLVFFQESFTEGRYEYVYLLKVTTPGSFRALPAQISAMYVPDARASSGPQSVTVETSAPAAAGPAK